MLYNQRDNNFTPQTLESLPLVYTHHAVKAQTSDRYGNVPSFSVLPANATVWSYETKYSLDTKSQKIFKYGVRFNLDSEYDVILIVVPNNGSYKVITTWLNRVDDLHTEADTKSYKTARNNNRLDTF